MTQQGPWEWWVVVVGGGMNRGAWGRCAWGWCGRGWCAWGRVLGETHAPADAQPSGCRNPMKNNEVHSSHNSSCVAAATTLCIKCPHASNAVPNHSTLSPTIQCCPQPFNAVPTYTVTYLPLVAAPCRSRDELAGVLRRDELEEGGGGGPAFAAAASASLPRSTHMLSCV